MYQCVGAFGPGVTPPGTMTVWVPAEGVNEAVIVARLAASHVTALRFDIDIDDVTPEPERERFDNGPRG